MSQMPTQLEKEELWKILVETVQALPMYKNHRRYVEDIIFKEKPDISPQELAIQLNIPIGESLVLLAEIRGSNLTKGSARVNTMQNVDHSLLEFSS